MNGKILPKATSLFPVGQQLFNTEAHLLVPFVRKKEVHKITH